MKKQVYMLVFLLLTIIPVAGKKIEPQTCRTECSRRYNRCLQQARGSEPRKKECARFYNTCVAKCDDQTSLP